jgi:hypothetical protein
MKNNDHLLSPAPLPDGSMPDVEFAPQRARPRSAQDILNRCYNYLDREKAKEEQKRREKAFQDAMAAAFPNYRNS